MTNICCYNQEYKEYLDDCGSVGCRLTGAVWDEWNHEDNCQECMYARDAGDECD